MHQDDKCAAYGEPFMPLKPVLCAAKGQLLTLPCGIAERKDDNKRTDYSRDQPVPVYVLEVQYDLNQYGICHDQEDGQEKSRHYLYHYLHFPNLLIYLTFS